MEEQLVDEEIKKLLSMLTSDFSTEAVQFIKDLDYPLTIKVEYTEENEELINTIELDSFNELKSALKTLPEVCVLIIEQNHASMIIEREVR